MSHFVFKVYRKILARQFSSLNMNLKYKIIMLFLNIWCVTLFSKKKFMTKMKQ